MIETKFTATMLGKIPHLELFTSHGIVRAPVKVKREGAYSTSRGLPMPVRVQRDTAFVYALPGGGEFIA